MSTSRSPDRWSLPTAMAACAALWGLSACTRSETSVKRVESLDVPVRDVRVLIASGAERVRVRGAGLVYRFPGDGEAKFEAGSGSHWVRIESDDEGNLLLDGTPIVGRSLSVGSSGSEPITFSESSAGGWSDTRRYPGVLRIDVRDDRGLDVINKVKTEDYVPGVVASEVWPTFHDEAFRAQAIAARTFVLYQMMNRRNSAFDVAATQGSQVYHGLRSDEVGRRAEAAAEYTRGIVCTFTKDGVDRLFCPFYSAACGGLTQSAALFGPENAVEPLMGGVACDYCKIAPGDTYRWGPVRMRLEDVTSRLVARYPDFSSLGRIARIEAAERTPAGRPVSLRVTGSSGESRDIMGERFRQIVGPQWMKSTDCDIRVRGGELILSNGRGYGHGLGLCQWGMQGRALQGKRAGEILRTYYPGSKLTRVY